MIVVVACGVWRVALLLRGGGGSSSAMVQLLQYEYNMFMTITDLLSYYLSVPRVHVVELGNHASQWAWVRGSGLLAAAAYAVAASGGCCGLMSMISKWQRDGATTARAVALRPSCPFRPPPPPPSRAQ
jgi:hypothetical protein